MNIVICYPPAPPPAPAPPPPLTPAPTPLPPQALPKYFIWTFKYNVYCSMYPTLQ